MKNEGVDKDYGQFCVFHLLHANTAVSLLCRNSYVSRFGQ
jgi:hypothetical protein